MEISGDLCEWEKIQGNLLGDNTLPPSLPPSCFSLPSPRVTRQSACVWERGATMCSFSKDCRQSSSLHQRGEEGERRRETGGKPLHSPPLLDSLPLSLYVSLLQRSPYNHSPSPPLRITHSLTQACLHHSSVHINDYIKYIQVGSMGLWGKAALSAFPFK